jgi:hypothetical protein
VPAVVSVTWNFGFVVSGGVPLCVKFAVTVTSPFTVTVADELLAFVILPFPDPGVIVQLLNI